MTISVSRLTFYLLCAAIFLLAFEQALWLFMGVDTEFKPYRLAIFLAIPLSLLYRTRLGTFASKISVHLGLVYLLGIILLMFWLLEGRQIDLGLAIRMINLLLVGISLYWLIIASTRRIKDLRNVLWIIYFSFILSSTIWFVMFFDATGFRVSGFFRNPNHFAYTVAISVLIGLYFAVNSKLSFWKRILIFCGVLGGVVLLLQSGSRGGMAALMVVFTIIYARFTFLNGKGFGKRFLIGIVTIGIISTVLLYLSGQEFFSSRLLDRFEASNIETGSGRFDLWRAGWIAAKDYVFMGLGIGQYQPNHFYYLNQVSGDVYSTIEDFELGLHSEYMTLFVEFGFLAIILYVSTIFTIWKRIRKTIKVNRENVNMALLMEAILILDLIFAASQTMYIFPYHWVVLGLCVAYVKIVSLETRRSSAQID